MIARPNVDPALAALVERTRVAQEENRAARTSLDKPRERYGRWRFVGSVVEAQRGPLTVEVAFGRLVFHDAIDPFASPEALERKSSGKDCFVLSCPNWYRDAPKDPRVFAVLWLPVIRDRATLERALEHVATWATAADVADLRRALLALRGEVLK